MSLKSCGKGELPSALGTEPPSASTSLFAHSHLGSSQHPRSSLPRITSKDSGWGLGEPLEIWEGILFHLSGRCGGMLARLMQTGAS